MLTPELGLIVWQIIIFGILFFLLSKFAWKPIINSLKERDQSIDDALQMAAKTRQEMAELKSGNEKLVAEAKAERDGIIKEAKAAADNMIAEAKAAAIEAARVENDKARVAFENEKQAAIAMLRKEAASLTIGVAEKVLKKELSDKASQEKLVSEFISDAKLN
jgi:F-type H+-transporting ATPase subunit b